MDAHEIRYWGLQIWRENPNVVQTGQKYLPIYMQTSVTFTVSGENKSP
jgi:hypothetical protein